MSIRRRVVVLIAGLSVIALGTGIAHAATANQADAVNADLAKVSSAYSAGDKASMDSSIDSLQTHLDAALDAKTTAKPATTTAVPVTAAPVTSSTTKPAVTAPAPVSGVAMGSRPASNAISCDGQSNVTIEGKTFKGIGNDKPSITISNCTNVKILNNDFIDDAEPIYVFNSKNIEIAGNRYSNITGPYQRNGSHRGNFTQWENSTGGSIHNNSGVGGDTEDVISIYKSGGNSAADPLVIENNHFEGTDWKSSSGSGMMVGDGGGSHIVIRNNTLVNIGQVGIGVPGGSDIHILNNTIFGDGRGASNVGIYVWDQSNGAGCSNIEVTGNKVNFKKASGVASGFWDGGNCGTITGVSANTFTASLTYDSVKVTL